MLYTLHICVTAEEFKFCKTLLFVYKNVKRYIDDVNFSLLINSDSLLLISGIYRHCRKSVKNHVNYLIRICQHNLDNVSYIGAASIYQQTKTNII